MEHFHLINTITCNLPVVRGSRKVSDLFLPVHYWWESACIFNSHSSITLQQQRRPRRQPVWTRPTRVHHLLTATWPTMTHTRVNCSPLLSSSLWSRAEASLQKPNDKIWAVTCGWFSQFLFFRGVFKERHSVGHSQLIVRSNVIYSYWFKAMMFFSPLYHLRHWLGLSQFGMVLSSSMISSDSHLLCHLTKSHLPKWRAFFSNTWSRNETTNNNTPVYLKCVCVKPIKGLATAYEIIQKVLYSS